ncbi:GTP cyclohydrolase I FolE [candidate division KSB1 bacterium]|nr:GTP cyclohydrolase I FolE [candidate division KSB1 bacterium]RQW06798.1 MAG: GTP cyclohydrolase I FolE [candidate division KSB1 bacterium]
MSMEKIEAAILAILTDVGEDPQREGLLRTPHRVAKAYEFLTKGYKADLDAIVNNAIFSEECNEMVVIRNIEFYSLCEHHMLPFFGKAHVAYLPKGKIIGLSKVPRIVDMFARRLQVQERMTNQIATTIDEILKPYGVAVVMEGKHLCMMMRGVEKQNSYVTSSAMLGTFKDERATRMEFLSLIRT